MPSNKRLLQSRQPSTSRASLAVTILDAQQNRRNVRTRSSEQEETSWPGRSLGPASSGKAWCRDIFGDVVQRSFNTAGPGYLAFVPGGGLYTAALANYISSIVNRYAGVWTAAPAAVEIETQALRWLAELMGMAPGSLGVFTTGGSMSNLMIGSSFLGSSTSILS